MNHSTNMQSNNNGYEGVKHRVRIPDAIVATARYMLYIFVIHITD